MFHPLEPMRAAAACVDTQATHSVKPAALAFAQMRTPECVRGALAADDKQASSVTPPRFCKPPDAASRWCAKGRLLPT
jgi:hypothetical protein